MVQVKKDGNDVKTLLSKIRHGITSKKNQETNRVQFLCTSLSPVQMRNDDHYIFMPASHWPHVETNPKQEMNALQ